MQREWSHLPNAAHIDRVLASLKANPKIWADVWDEAVYDIGPWDVAVRFIQITGRDGVWNAARRSASGAAWDWSAGSTGTSAYYAAYYASCHPIIALIAYDDAAKYLDLPLDQLQMLYALTEHPAAHLLQLAVLAFDMEKALA